MGTTQKNISLAGIFILGVITFCAYMPALTNGFIWDDDSYVTQNEHIRTFDGLKKIWFSPSSSPQYYPLVFTSYWLEYKLFTLKPFGYHLTNLVLHILSAVILWKILTTLNVNGAWCAALIFAIHPVHVESVVWITERKNVLSGFFYLLSLFFYLSFVNIQSNKKKIEEVKYFFNRYYFIALVFFMCALLSKTITCTLPAVIFVLLFWVKEKVEKTDFYFLLPFFFTGIVMGISTIVLEKTNVGAQGEDFAFTFFERIIIAGRALWFYLGKILWPAPLMFIYPRWQIDSTVWWQHLFYVSSLVIICFFYYLIRFKRVGKGPLICVLIFAGTLFPALGFFNVYPFLFSFVADHFQYLASISMIVLFVSLLESFFFPACEKYFTFSIYRDKNMFPSVVYGVLFFFLFITARRQTHIYTNVTTLWSDTISKNQTAWIAYNNLGVELAKEGKAEQALLLYERAVKLRPNYVEALLNLGATLVETGKVKQGMREYEKALKINPNNEKIYNNLGVAFAKLGDAKGAVSSFKSAITLNSSYKVAINNLESVLRKIEKGYKK